jgi:methylmalonyl-CoA/ethylmalonyl-CoA epimerase
MSDAQSTGGAPDYQLDHVCLAVRKIAPARAVLEKMLGYTARTEVVTNTRQQVNVQFMRKAGSIDIKLIEPSSLTSPLVDFIKERVAGGVQDLESKGARVLAAPQPGEAFDEAEIAFAFLGAGLNVELIDTDRRRNEKP